jgi:Na+/melibiose symporter-like transporter
VGWGFIALYTLSYTGGSLLFLAPLLVSLALKVNDLVGIEAAPRNLALVTGVGSLLAIVANPFFGRLSDRTTARMGMRRPWILLGVTVGTVGIVIVAMAPSVPVSGAWSRGCWGCACRSRRWSGLTWSRRLTSPSC